MKTLAILPIKKAEKSKTRLSKSLSEEERKTLSYKMFVHVWKVCIQAGLTPIAVTSDPLIQAKFGGVVDEGRGLNHALSEALNRLNASRFFIILPDLPLLRPENILKIMRLRADYVICPDRRLTGTNIIYVDGYKKYVPCFGYRSFRKHLGQKADAKVFYQIGCALDVDTPSDLSSLRRLAPSWSSAKN